MTSCIYAEATKREEKTGTTMIVCERTRSAQAEPNLCLVRERRSQYGESRWELQEKRNLALERLIALLESGATAAGWDQRFPQRIGTEVLSLQTRLSLAHAAYTLATGPRFSHSTPTEETIEL